MLKTIIKRDGTRQAFDPDKLNKWAIWAGALLAKRSHWAGVVLKTMSAFGEETTSKELQAELIKQCVRTKRWPEALMAGRLYVSECRKDIYDGRIPTIRKLHAKMLDIGQMVKLDYSDEDYAYLESIIDHERDMNMAYFQIKQMRKKYSLQDMTKAIEFETPQFTLMRMAMALSEKNDKSIRLQRVESMYNSFSEMKVNAPTPNYINLGTRLKGLVSCCLYKAGDNIPSINAANTIAEMMTAASAGMGGITSIRSIGDPVRGGRIEHLGKMPYYKAKGAIITENIQAGRAGAGNEHFSIYDPEAPSIIMLQNPMTPVEVRNRMMHFTYIRNNFFIKKVARNEDMFTFNVFTAPDLYEAQFSKDPDEFERIYNKYEADPNFKKNYVKARDLLVLAREQKQEVATLYSNNSQAINYHTPHKDPIYSTNLCVEITQPTYEYASGEQLWMDKDLSTATFVTSEDKTIVFEGEKLYNTNRENPNNFTTKVLGCYLKEGDTVDMMLETGCQYSMVELKKFVEYKRNPEVSTCALGGIVITNIKDDDDYFEQCYNALVMIDECIHTSEFPLPHIGYTSRQRINAGVGILGLALHMARKGLKYDTPEGLIEIDKVFERHAYFCIKASLKLGQERGNAPWMHRTKWPEGWLPIDTYNRNVDELVPFELRYDWEGLRAAIIANGGIRNSSVIAMMPTESSSKASGAPNGMYPIRDLTLKKTDSSNLLDWCAPDNDILEDQYQLAWEISVMGQIEYTGVAQKWCDQAISFDEYRDRTEMIDSPDGPVVKPVAHTDLIKEEIALGKYGIKSEYYGNSYTSESAKMTVFKVPTKEESAPIIISAPGCDSGVCTL